MAVPGAWVCPLLEETSAPLGPPTSLLTPVWQVGELAGPPLPQPPSIERLLQFTTKGATRACADTSSRARASAAACYVCFRVCSRHGVQAFQAVPQNRVVEGLDLPLPTVEPVEAARPILPAWGCWGRASPFLSPVGWSAGPARPLWLRTGHGGA